MEPALSSTILKFPFFFACKLAGKKCGNFKMIDHMLVPSFKLKTKHLYEYLMLLEYQLDCINIWEVMFFFRFLRLSDFFHSVFIWMLKWDLWIGRNFFLPKIFLWSKLRLIFFFCSLHSDMMRYCAFSNHNEWNWRWSIHRNVWTLSPIFLVFCCFDKLSMLL